MGALLSQPRKQTAEVKNCPLELRVHIAGYRNCPILDTQRVHVWQSIYDISPSAYPQFQNSTEATRAVLFSDRGLMVYLNGAGWLSDVSESATQSRVE